MRCASWAAVSALAELQKYAPNHGQTLAELAGWLSMPNSSGVGMSHSGRSNAVSRGQLLTKGGFQLGCYQIGC